MTTCDKCKWWDQYDPAWGTCGRISDGWDFKEGDIANTGDGNLGTHRTFGCVLADTGKGEA